MQIEHGGGEFGVEHQSDQPDGFVQRLTTRLNKFLGFRRRAQFERRFRQHAQGAAAADEHLRQVVTRDVLHHFAARPDDASVGQGRFDAYEVIANRAPAEAPRATGIFFQQFADREPLRPRRVNRQPLPALPQLRLQRQQRDACFHCDGQVLRYVLDDAIEGGQVHALDLFPQGTGVRQATGEIFER